ncbi:MAG: NAD(P)/FAD-dependent oxidoreductase [bacterium]
MATDADVLIVGAGPAGSAAAMQLARNGHRVILVDRAKFPRDKPCGDYCDPGAVHAIEQLGCLPDALAAGAVAIPGMRIVAQDGTELSASFPNGRGLLLPRVHLDYVLLQRAASAGAEIVEGFRVDEVAAGADGVEIRDSRDRRLKASLLIAADGMRSVTARRLGLYSEVTSGRFTVGAYFEVPDTMARGELHLGPGLYCGVARFGRGRANVCIALPRERLKGRSPEQAFSDALPSLPVLADDLAGARRISAFRSTGPVGFRTSQVVSDRVLLVGDAAMQIDPMTGQGICFALRSGILAAETAAHGLTTQNLSGQGLGAYARRRAVEFGRKVTVARMLRSLALRPAVTPSLVRRLVARPELASQLLGVTGDILAPNIVLHPHYLWNLFVGHAPRA